MATRNVAVLIDFENISSANDVATVLEIGAIRGAVVAKKAFGDWTGPIEKGQEELTMLGVELVHQMGIGKGRNGCDMRLVIDAMDLLHDPNRDIDAFVLATCDVDFVPLVVRLRSAGKLVVGAGRSEATSDLFKATVDEFIAIGNNRSSTVKNHRSRPKSGTSIAVPEPPASTRPKAPVEPPIKAEGRSARQGLDPETKLLILSAVFDVSERYDGTVKGAPLHESVKAIEPNFDFRELGFDNFADMLASHGQLEVHGRGLQGDITVTVKSS